MAYAPDPEVVALLCNGPALVGARGHARLQRGQGCDHCRQTGYRGRTGLFELMVMSDALRKALLAGEDLTTLRRLARDEGMTALREDGWRKVQAGITTVEEVLRVVGE